MSKTILITGANRGIGLELVKQYATSGCSVLACCRHPDQAKDLQQLAQKHSNITVYPLDVSQLNQINQLAEQLKNTPIDILFNNAGISGQAVAFDDVKYDDFLTTLQVNSIAPVMMAQAFLKHVSQGQLKIIVNISSTLGSIELNQDNSWSWFPYRVSKSALNSATRCMANSLRDAKITAIAMHPGWVQTDMGGKEAEITPEESVAGMKQFLTTVSLKESGNFFGYDGKALPW